MSLFKYLVTLVSLIKFRKLFGALENLGSWWMLSHLSDLFFRAGVMEDDFDFGKKREEYILQYSKWLAEESMLNDRHILFNFFFLTLLQN